MTRRLFVFALTAIWLLGALYMFYTFDHPKDLNGWGDFFAGIFAPLAFLWLVLGYMQQGEELRQGTEALQLQAEELRNSVAQQTALVELNREQLNLTLEAIDEERQLRREAARPNFIPQHSGSPSAGGIVTYKLTLVNIGNTATKFRMRFDPAIEKPPSHNLARVVREQEVRIDLQMQPNVLTTATITYIDALGYPGEVQFTVEAGADRRLVIGDVHQVS